MRIDFKEWHCEYEIFNEPEDLLQCTHLYAAMMISQAHGNLEVAFEKYKTLLYRDKFLYKFSNRPTWHPDYDAKRRARYPESDYDSDEDFPLVDN